MFYYYDPTYWLLIPGLLRQADPQHVMEYSLALIAVLNEVGKTPPCQATPTQVLGSPF